MAKVAFSKLKCKLNEDSIPLQIGEETIAVKQYLPIQEKLALISRVVMIAHEEDFNYANPVKADIYTEIEVLVAYTNITFTDKQKQDTPKLYDALKSSGILDKIIKTIPQQEIDMIFNGVARTAESLYKYQNSVLGLLDTIKTDYSNMELDLDSLAKSIKDPEMLGFVQDMLSKIN